MTDFIGFTLNGIHSSQLHIVRTSDGSRFNKNLLPGTNDMTSQVTGHDGIYYWGRDFKNYTISLNIAYNDMEEKHIRKLQQLINSKTPIELILDEEPYKKWCVIPTSNCKLNYVCFDKYDSINHTKLYTNGTYNGLGRIYKGEGQLIFTTLEPFARSTNKYKDGYTAAQLFDWNDSVGLKSKGDLDIWKNNKFIVYNPSDKLAMPIIEVEFISAASGNKTLTLAMNNQTLILTNVILQGEDTGLIINCETQLITGNKTKTIYNKYITSGTFEKLMIPCGFDIINHIKTTYDFVISGENITINNTPTIAYDYLFI